MTISVIIPTCDRPDFLLDAIASVKNQTLPPQEIIIVNNGKAPLKENLYPNIKIINTKPYIGASAARNIGAKAAKSEFIAFLDDDDLWDKNFLKHLYTKLKTTNATYAVGDLYKFSTRKAPSIARSFSWFPRETKDVLYGRNPGFGGGNFLVLKEAFLHVNGFDEDIQMSEDQALPLKLFLAGYKITGESRAHYLAREHEGPRLRHHYIKHRLDLYKKFKDQMTLQQRICHLFRANKRAIKVFFRSL